MKRNILLFLLKFHEFKGKKAADYERLPALR
ncbi:hypothetical protein PAECIP111890_00306 [Paenibacillus sp. JJ-223]|nr:hypothetical protein PAECIP111890_00306 [Paenibacillus sp. JJ-223]